MLSQSVTYGQFSHYGFIVWVFLFLWINAIKLLPVLIIFLQEQIPELKTHLLFAA